MFKIIGIMLGLVLMILVLYILLIQLKEHKYVEDYQYLSYLIDESEITFENFTIICREFDKLYQNNADHKATRELKEHFMKKYQLYHPDVYNYNT